MNFSKIYLASDHGGLDLKKHILDHLAERDVMAEDLGPFGPDSVDYPDYAAKCALALEQDSSAGAIIICGSGIGISIAANRHHWIRAALVHDMTSARLCREHNNANVLALGERLMGVSTALDCVDLFLQTPFEGGRHEGRVEKLTNLPKK
ncbi:MAG: ribose 5-phosphate isomerase B [Candidatus Puniceispirillaceae bacterium]